MNQWEAFNLCHSEWILCFNKRTSCCGTFRYFPLRSPHLIPDFHILTRFEQLDSLGALVRLLGVLFVDVVVDLGLRREGLEPLQDSGDEFCHMGGRGGPGVGQGHVYHEDIGQHTRERAGGGWEKERKGKTKCPAEINMSLKMDSSMRL